MVMYRGRGGMEEGMFCWGAQETIPILKERISGVEKYKNGSAFIAVRESGAQ